MELTVLICTHNRAALLEKTITSILACRRPENCDISILVVANACNDDTLKTVQKLADNSSDIPVRYLEEPIAGKSNALNLAIDNIPSGYICLIDDDHRVDSRYFESVAQSIRQYPGVPIFCGQIIPDWTGDEPAWIHDKGKYKIYPLPIPHFELGNAPFRVNRNNKLPGGGNLIIERKVFDSIGNFSTALGPQRHNLAGSEDSDFILRALDAGVDIQYSPTIVQYHYVDNDRLKFKYLLLKSFQRSKTIMLAKHPQQRTIPKYFWAKLANYFFAMFLPGGIARFRYYAMRVAATLGEISGLISPR
ncbi:glycosyltransferase [Methylomarinum vadi]|uniref:glycosyltransferase n=1 Tax=Methylomarinum vadi TaxID=438855 RepID=UPI00056410D0|nr:glycosyltransferase [Methylomarinum vadi]